MTQIIWKKPDDSRAVTTLVEATDAYAEAAKLQQAELVPADWSIERVLGDDEHVDVAAFLAGEG